ncbi:carbohydrate porin [Herbaspirillum sp. RTI4]|uniref:carbohydrate porin n=1 Tax=Herbaspirillum sp. RTI4 TaxID=3048640 RepID=UPI002AB52EA4|nr:carbohydrate porin [Herbaspirillum sp. RTI4]MDY7578886.1 carbohydrate porin [Herbaspirillum sp. RTI4]MEA9981975.1 carbohydrate porin [Herbaspirillum sp. RTI4]
MFHHKKNILASVVFAHLFSLPLIAQAQEVLATASELPPIQNEVWNAKLQGTYIWQKKPSINSPYAGTNSLLPQSETAYSYTSTAYFGLRLWQGAELYFNPEATQSVAFSTLHGLGGLTNSEQQKGGGAVVKTYVARMYLKQTFGFGGGQDAVESGQNQLAGMVDKRRLVITAGKLAVIDIFDNNAYAHDARTQFTNWAFLTQGAFDYAADEKGYTVGIAAEYYFDEWVFRGGRFEVPILSNGPQLDSKLATRYGDQIELEHAHTLADQPGKIRLLAFRNREIMGSFTDALAYARANGGTPDVGNVRKDSFKTGYGLNLEQSLRSDVGMFARASWSDGKSETYSFTEIDNSVSTGIVVKGARWGRERDSIGLAVAQNGLSKSHRDYLAQGGLGAFLGDGRLNYKSEKISELYYNARVIDSTSMMFGFQHIVNPGYNADRGPVNVMTVRVHIEL